MNRTILFAGTLLVAGLTAWTADAVQNDVTFPDMNALTHYTTVERGVTVEHMLGFQQLGDAVLCSLGERDGASSSPHALLSAVAATQGQSRVKCTRGGKTGEIVHEDDRVSSLSFPIPHCGVTIMTYVTIGKVLADFRTYLEGPLATIFPNATLLAKSRHVEARLAESCARPWADV